MTIDHHTSMMVSVICTYPNLSCSSKSQCTYWHIPGTLYSTGSLSQQMAPSSILLAKQDTEPYKDFSFSSQNQLLNKSHCPPLPQTLNLSPLLHLHSLCPWESHPHLSLAVLPEPLASPPLLSSPRLPPSCSVCSSHVERVTTLKSNPNSFYWTHKVLQKPAPDHLPSLIVPPFSP